MNTPAKKLNIYVFVFTKYVETLTKANLFFKVKMAFNHVDASRLSGAYNEPCLPHHYHHHHHHGFIINSLWATPCNFPITSAVVFVDSPGYTSWNYPGFLEASRGTIGFVGPLQETQSEQSKTIFVWTISRYFTVLTYIDFNLKIKI